MVQKRQERETRQVSVTQSLINSYRKQVDRQGDAAAAYMDKAIATYVGKYPDASTAQIRKFTYETMQAALPNFTDLAETLSCEFMSHLAEKYGWGDVNPVITGSTDYKLVDRKLHYLADLLNEGDLDGFKRSVTDVTKFYVKRSAQESMIRNCIDASVRYARVPSGFETCSFCFMLASRGFVYGDEEKAGATHKFHPNCDCIVVPGAYGRTKIDGYDPKGMYDRWRSCHEAIGGCDGIREAWDALPQEDRMARIAKEDGDSAKAFAKFEEARIMREVETRDWHWLYTGEVPKVMYTSDKAREETLKKRPHEVRTAERLSKIGFQCELGKDSKKIGKDSRGRTIFDGYADNPDGIEFKTVLTSKNAYGAVKNYFENSINKKNLKRLVIDNYESLYLSDKEIINAIVELSEKPEYIDVFKRISVLKKDGNILDVINRN